MNNYLNQHEYYKYKEDGMMNKLLKHHSQKEHLIIEIEGLITWNGNRINGIERINFKINSSKRRKIWIIILYHNY